MMKWSEERKRKHSQIMLEHIKNRKYDQIIKIRYDRIEREIHALWCEACPIDDREVITVNGVRRVDYTGMRERAGFTVPLKNKVKERDENKCQVCGQKAKPLTRKYKCLDVHHIDCDYKNNNLNNLILLCKDCHSEAHHLLLKERWDFHHPLASRID